MENNMFDTLDLGTGKPTSVADTVIEVKISINEIIEQYAKGFLDECARVSPLKYDKVLITEDELLKYVSFLLDKRVESVNNNCRDWRKLKVLVIPTFLQYVLACVGKVILYDDGLIFMPVKEPVSDYSLDDAFQTSSKLRAFKGDLQIVEDAMPRSIYGDADVMSSIVIAGVVHSLREVAHPVATYVAAFLNFTLGQVTTLGETEAKPKMEKTQKLITSDYSILFRKKYDDVAFIKFALSAERSIYQ